MLPSGGDGVNRRRKTPGSADLADSILCPLTGTAGSAGPSASRLREGFRPLTYSAHSGAAKNETDLGGEGRGKMPLSSLTPERPMWHEVELRPQLRFVGAPVLVVPFQFFTLLLEVTDVLGGAVSSMRLLESLRSRQRRQLQSLLLEKPHLDCLLPPVEVGLSMELHDYGFSGTDCSGGRDDNGSHSCKTVAVVATHPSPFASMRYTDGGSLINVLTSRMDVPPFSTVSGILSDVHAEGLAISRLRSGGGGGEHTEWSSFAHSEPCIAMGPPEGSQCGVQFRVCSRTRAIVGLFSTRLLDSMCRSSGGESAGGEGDRSGDDDYKADYDGDFLEASAYVAPECTWCFLSYSIHFSATGDDLEPVAFRIYELGAMVEIVGTQVANIGDMFALRFSECGRCIYLQNDKVLHVSSRLVSPHNVYSLLVRLAYQQTAPALDRVVLLPFLSGRPRVEIVSLACKPQWPRSFAADGSAVASFAADSEPATTDVILRGWLHGFPTDAALHTLSLLHVPFPSWAVAAMSLASSFALGATGFCSGCCGSTLATLREHHRHAPLLQRQDPLPSRPRTYCVAAA